VIDHAFFTNISTLVSRPFVQGSALNGQEYSRAKLFPHQNAVADDGSALNGRKAGAASVLVNQGADHDAGKKRHKKIKRVKQRSGKGYDL
jgi:large subunit GTPase 1